MAYAFSQEVNDPRRDDRVALERADIWGDLLEASLAVRFSFSTAFAALGAYAIWFGFLAAIDIWRSHFLSFAQIGIVVATLAVQSMAAYGIKLRPVQAGIVFGAMWTVPTALMVISDATSNDYFHASIYVLTPMALSLMNGWLAARANRRLALPDRRGG